MGTTLTGVTSGQIMKMDFFSLSLDSLWFDHLCLSAISFLSILKLISADLQSQSVRCGAELYKA